MNLRRALGMAIAVAAAADARCALWETEKLAIYADFRLRAETDWDSQDESGVARDDRTRLRARLRAGLRFDPSPKWRFEVRMRSGQEDNQQSPLVTLVDFNDNDTGDVSFELDRWYVRGETGGFHGWAGRNHLPFWTQDELLLDDDITMTGAAAGWSGEVGPGELAVTAGYFSPPVGMKEFSGNLGGAQVAYRPDLASTRWTFAVGAYAFDANPDDPDALALLEDNGTRDYRILQAAVQARLAAGGRPLVLGGDYMHNAEDDPVDPDQNDGYVILATWGELVARNDWHLGYYYARIEKLAVHNSYSQDDWVRWGTAAQTRASNMAGHELRFGWAFAPNVNLLARLFVAEAITTVEDGKRLRVDLNWAF